MGRLFKLGIALCLCLWAVVLALFIIASPGLVGLGLAIMLGFDAATLRIMTIGGTVFGFVIVGLCIFIAWRQHKAAEQYQRGDLSVGSEAGRELKNKPKPMAFGILHNETAQS